MKSIFLAGFFLLTFFSSFGKGADTIEIRKGFSTVYRQHSKNLTPRQLLAITKSNEQAYNEMRLAKTNYDVGCVFAYAGGFVVGWQLGAAIAGGEPNWTAAGIGAGLIGISIPFSVAYNKHAKKAAGIYNNGLRQTAGNNHINFSLGLTANGFGLRMAF